MVPGHDLSPGFVLQQSGAVSRVRRAVQEFLGPIPGPAIRIAGAVIVVLAGWYGSRLLVRQFGRPLARRFQRPSLARTVLRSVRAAMLVVTGFLALGVLGVRFPDIFISVTVFSAVVGVVLAPIVGSIINGVFVIADQPYEIGDMIELADSDTRGFVEDVTLRYTKMFTLDNTFLVIPNGNIRDRDVINYSAEDERTRLSLDVVVTYESDLDRARRIIERAARDVDGVITGGPGIRIGAARYPAGPTCYIDEFGDHGVHLRLRYWVKQPYKLLTARSLVQTRVWDALAETDVEIAYPHQQLVFDEHSGTARVSVDGNGRGPPSGGGSPSNENGNGDRSPGDPSPPEREAPRPAPDEVRDPPTTPDGDDGRSSDGE